MVVVCVAVLVYIGLEVVIRSVDARNEREFDRRVDSCADYAAVSYTHLTLPTTSIV